MDKLTQLEEIKVQVAASVNLHIEILNTQETIPAEKANLERLKRYLDTLKY